MLRVTMAMAVGALSLAGGVAAQEAIPTAGTGDAPATPSAAVAPLQLPQNSIDDGALPLLGPCGGVIGFTDGRPVKPDTRVHGQVWAGVGTSGYRDIGGAACVPIAKDKGSISIAVDRAQINGARGW